MIVIPVVDGTLGTVIFKGLEKRLRELEIRGRIGNSVLFRSAMILRRVLDDWENFQHQKFDDISLLKPRALCLICRHFELPQNKNICEIKIIFVINQFQTMQNLHL